MRAGFLDASNGEHQYTEHKVCRHAVCVSFLLHRAMQAFSIEFQLRLATTVHLVCVCTRSYEEARICAPQLTLRASMISCACVRVFVQALLFRDSPDWPATSIVVLIFDFVIGPTTRLQHRRTHAPSPILRLLLQVQLALRVANSLITPSHRHR